MGRLLEAVRSGDERAMLEALRDTIAETIESTGSGRDIAALSKRLIEVNADLRALPDPDAEVNPVDGMAAMIAEFDEYEDPRFDDEDEG